MDYLYKSTREQVLSCVKLVFIKYDVIPQVEPGARKNRINHLIDNYNFLHDESILDGEFRNKVFREGLIQYIFLTSTKSNLPIGIAFPEMFDGSMPLWFLANYGATVCHSFGVFSLSVSEMNTKF